MIFRLETMKAINQLCKQERPRKTITNLYPDLYTENSIYDVIQRFAPDFNETFVFCKRFDKWIDCKKVFYPIITREGYCYTFNMMSLTELLTDELVSLLFAKSIFLMEKSDLIHFSGFFQEYQKCIDYNLNPFRIRPMQPTHIGYLMLAVSMA